jgi:thiol-disulfide isomerase/thioredoxin
MRKSLFFLFSFTLSVSYGLAQTATEIISAVMRSQQSLRTVFYKVIRHDTLVTGDIRTLTGQAKIRVDTSDPLFGFLFWAKEDGVNSQLVFNGNMSYQTDDTQKTYSISTGRSDMKEIIHHSGGRIVVPDLAKLDTTGAIGLTVTQDKGSYYLTVVYPDLTRYDVIKRFKMVTIDKSSLLPVAVRQHQETLDKVQDLSWNIDHMVLNDQDFYYDFSSPDFVKAYDLKVPVVTQSHPLMALKGRVAPLFALKSFGDSIISLREMAGKVVLLDFWEVWCGPCVESMPKVQHLYDRFKNEGFTIYGIVNDIKQLESSKKFVGRKPEIQFPMLVGNAGLKKDYNVDAVPQYVLIGRNGKIRWVGLGYSDAIGGEIEKALSER